MPLIYRSSQGRVTMPRKWWRACGEPKHLLLFVHGRVAAWVAAPATDPPTKEEMDVLIQDAQGVVDELRVLRGRLDVPKSPEEEP